MCLPGGAIVSIDAGGHRHFEHRLLARPAVLGVVVGALEVFERRADVHRAVVVRHRRRSPGSTVNCGGSERARLIFAEADAVVDSRDRASRNSSGSILRVEELFECDVGIDARGDDRRFDLRAVFQPDAARRRGRLVQDVLDRRLAADFDAEIAARALRAPLASPPMPPLHVAPHAARAARFAHHVMEQHVRAAGRADGE